MERRKQPLEPAGIEPEAAGIADGRFDVGGEAAQPAGDLRDGLVDASLRDLGGAQPSGQRETLRVTHARQHAKAARVLVDPQQHALRMIAVDHGHRGVVPVRVVLQQQLQGEGGEVNAGRPVHGTPPCVASRDPGVCP